MGSGVLSHHLYGIYSFKIGLNPFYPKTISEEKLQVTSVYLMCKRRVSLNVMYLVAILRDRINSIREITRLARVCETPDHIYNNK